MHHQSFISLLRRILSTPTAPFHEYRVAAVIEEMLAGFPHVKVSKDRFGNRIACYRRGRKNPRFAFAAHMDHPGWVREKGEAVFLGGVPVERLQSHPVEWFDDFGMWDLEPFRLENGIVHARVCDDLVGCAAIVALFSELEAQGAEATVYGLFTRAEEVGFVGAVHLAQHWPLPPGVVFVSLETSAPRGGAVGGKGPVIRVGDRLSVFDDATTASLIAAATDAGIPHQRALLDGGSCEATAMNLFGIPAAGISVLLGNYHNCPPDQGIATEFIHLDDAKQLVQLITAATLQAPAKGGGSPGQAALRKKLLARVQKHQPYVRAAAKHWR